MGYYINNEYHEVLKVSEDTDVVWEFLKEIEANYPGVKLYAHSAATFDSKFILDCLTKHKQVVRFPAGLGKLVWVEPNISFEDSYLLLGRNLAACCEAFGVERKLQWDHSETVNIWEMQSKLDAFRNYLKRDCISLSQSLDAFTKILLEKFDITPSSTLSLTAVKAFNKKFYPVEKIASNTEYENIIRKATYGGRNEVYRRYGENIHFYDVKRMYVSCYDVPIPVGKLGVVKPNIDRGVIGKAKVKVPDSFLIGPLPYRYHGHLIFPVGEFEGWWDMRELRFASTLGVDVTLLGQMDADEKPVLEEFGNTMDELTKTSNEELSRIWKIFGLRLSGKFGQRRRRTEIKHISEIEDQTGYCPIDKNEIYHEIDVYSNGHRSPYVKPAINMRIRAEARVRHLGYLLKSKHPFYCDTDSDYTSSIMPTGDNLGDLREVDFAQRAYFIGCKFYGYINNQGQLRQRTSGFRDYELTESDFKKILDGKEIKKLYENLSGNWRQILQGMGVTLRDKPRTLRSPEYSNRIIDGLDTYPIKLPVKEEQ